MITRKKKISQIPEIYSLSLTSKLLVVENGQSAIISTASIISSISSISSSHITDYNNPHQVTKAQVGLGNVDNTSDLNKPLSTLATQALLEKQPLLVSGTNIKTINGQSLLGSGNLIITSPVTSVNSQTGAVNLTTDSIPEGGQKYYSNALVAAYADTVYVKLSTSYTNPSFINSLSFSKLTGLPNTLLGYGITDPIVVTSGTYANPSWITSLAWNKLTGVPTFVSTLDSLTDVYVNAVETGQVLKWDGVQWVNGTNVPINQVALLQDVQLSGLQSGDLFQFNGTKWQNISVGTAIPTPTLTQVTTAGATTTNFITAGGLTSNGSVTASGTIARGNYINNTLVASANNDVLVGLDINPTFNTGAYTGVINMGIRFKGDIYPSVDNLYSIGSGSFRIAAVWGFQSIFSYYYAPSGQSAFFGVSGNTNINFPINNTVYGRFHATTGNFTLQNGGTFTDAGFRLDVNGTARIQNNLTVLGIATAVEIKKEGGTSSEFLKADGSTDSTQYTPESLSIAYAIALG